MVILDEVLTIYGGCRSPSTWGAEILKQVMHHKKKLRVKKVRIYFFVNSLKDFTKKLNGTNLFILSSKFTEIQRFKVTKHAR